MASEGGAGLLPISRCPRELDSVARLLAARLQTVAECFSSSQSTRPGALGAFVPHLVPVDSPTPCSASLSSCPLRRHSSSVRAVCVNALARICAGGDQRWSSLPRQLSVEFFGGATFGIAGNQTRNELRVIAGDNSPSHHRCGSVLGNAVPGIWHIDVLVPLGGDLWGPVRYPPLSVLVPASALPRITRFSSNWIPVKPLLSPCRLPITE